MRLTGNILLRALREQRSAAAWTGIERCAGLEGPLLFCGEPALLPGWVYVVDAGAFAQAAALASDDNLFILVGEGESGPFPEKGGWIRMEPETTAGEVLNLLISAFAFYGHWEEKLESIQYRFGTVEEMLEASLPIFHDPLMVTDADLSVVYWVAEDVSSKEKLPFFNGGLERMEIINAMMQDPAFIRNRLRTESYWGPEYHLGFRCICWNVIRGGDPQYCLTVVEDGEPLQEADLDLLEILGFHVKFVLYHQERKGAGRFESLGKVLDRILTDRTLDYLEASRLLTDLGWNRQDTYMCLVYQLTYLDRSVLPTVSICRYMEEQYACSSFLHDDYIVTFFDLTRCALRAEEIQNQLKPFIRDSYLKAGFSRSVTGHMHLRHQYVQATLALDVGSRKYPYQWVHYFDQVAFLYIQEQVTRRLPGELLVHEGLLKLREKDHEQGTEYRKTLRVYLDNGLNAVHSARDLYIHRSTFLYRLDKIKEILESDLTDPDELLYLGLSLRLMELGSDR